MKVAEVSQQNPKLITFCISVPPSSGINALRTRQLSLKTKPMAEYLLALLTHQRGAGTSRISTQQNASEVWNVFGITDEVDRKLNTHTGDIRI